MVSTDGIADIPLQEDANKTNIFGYTVVPMLSSYQPTTIVVNPLTTQAAIAPDRTRVIFNDSSKAARTPAKTFPTSPTRVLRMKKGTRAIRFLPYSPQCSASNQEPSLRFASSNRAAAVRYRKIVNICFTTTCAKFLRLLMQRIITQSCRSPCNPESKCSGVRPR